MSVLDRFPVVGDRRIAVRVTDDALRWIRAGHPWLFEDSITSESPGGGAGDLTVVFDRKRRFRAIGLFDPTSPIRVRILHHGDPVPIDDRWWASRLAEIVNRRRTLLDTTETTGFRAVNGENDGLPGLVVDRYATVAVVKIYTPAWVPHLRTLVPVIEALLEVDTIVLRLGRNTEDALPTAFPHRAAAEPRPTDPHPADRTVTPVDGMALLGRRPTEPVRFRENGLVVEADVVAGQKTGYFLDQRDNRRRVRDRSDGARVLDVFSAGGGFTLAAAAGGATSVASVDISGPALEATRRNLAHNRHLDHVRRCRHETRRGDAFPIMEDLAAAGRRFDIVIVDPPSFAPNAASVVPALRSYQRLTELAVALVEDGGLLVQSSCSSRVTPAEFFAAVDAGARRAGVELDEQQRTGHPVDHPIGFQHGEYLKTVFARIRRPGGGRRRG